MTYYVKCEHAHCRNQLTWSEWHPAECASCWALRHRIETASPEALRAFLPELQVVENKLSEMTAERDRLAEALRAAVDERDQLRSMLVGQAESDHPADKLARELFIARCSDRKFTKHVLRGGAISMKLYGELLRLAAYFLAGKAAHNEKRDRGQL